MPITVYCERNAMRPWLKALEGEGRIVLVLFPYDGDNPYDGNNPYEGNNPGRVRRATPSLVTMDSTWVTWDMTIPISDMDGSANLDEIRRIIGRQNEFDARHLASAYKSGCRAFFTTDGTDILDHAALLEPLLGLRLFHPDRDRDAFLAFLDAVPADPRPA